jgi:hypothetical protein
MSGTPMIKDRHFADGKPMPATWDDAYAADVTDLEKALRAAEKKRAKYYGRKAATSSRGLDSIISSALKNYQD